MKTADSNPLNAWRADASPAYLAAYDANAIATAAFTKAQNDYRAQRIGDAEYLAARAIYKQAEAAFNVAFAAEQERTTH